MKMALLGNPNAGKSSVINQLTGSQLFASNYPGTSTEIAKAKMIINNIEIELYDTLGVYSIYSDNEESNITRKLLATTEFDLLIHIIDAANLERNLVLSYELLDLHCPLLLVLNQVDRARELGIYIDDAALSRQMGCPVLVFSAASNEGIDNFKKYLHDFVAQEHKLVEFPESGHLPQRIVLGENYVCSGNCGACSIPVSSCTTEHDLQRAEKARKTAKLVSSSNTNEDHRWLNHLQDYIDSPVLGTLTLLIIAYLGLLVLTKFIGLSEGPIKELLLPFSQWLHRLILSFMPTGFIASVLSKAIPEGFIIPFTIIMPAMLMVSFLMSLLEDTGLLPRYSVALERLGHLFGVSGQAIIPLSLGFGCRTPAVIATRVLPNDAQRFIVITLLSIVVPCAATVGVLVMISAKFKASLPVIVASMLVVMLVLGLLLSRLYPQKEEFIYELPPLRIPSAKNVWTKIKLRFSGFFTEVLPLLLLMSIGIRAIIESNLLEVFQGLEWFTRLLFGIPAEAFVAVLITIFQRYLAPLVLLNLSLGAREATIALSMIALSLPCLPVMVVTVRELGFKSLFKILLMGLATSIGVGVLLNLLLPV